MIKLNKITIENFRGIRNQFEIEFNKGNNLSSALIYGRNGTGKSSIVDAWEWLINGKIEAMNKEGVSENDYPHRLSKGINSYIQIKYFDSKIKNVTCKFNPSKPTIPIKIGEFDELKNICKYPNYLRYADLQGFVFKSKTEKYRYIAKYFGLENFAKIQENLQTAINKLKLFHERSLIDYNNSLKNIVDITKTSIVDEENIIKFVNKVGGKYAIDKIHKPTEFDLVTKGLEKLVESNPITKELIEWKNFQVKLKLFYKVEILKKDCEALEITFNELKENEESIKLLILSNLYDSSIQIIPKLDNKSLCPLCDKQFDGDLLTHIKNKHFALNVLNRKKNDFDTKKELLEKKFVDFSNQLNNILSEESVAILNTLNYFFENLKETNKTLPQIISCLEKSLKDLDSLDICLNPGLEKIESISNSKKDILKLVEDKITTLSSDKNSKSLAQDYKDINNIMSFYKIYILSEEKLMFFERTKINLTFVFNELTSFIQEKIQDTFTKIELDVAECFNFLESDNYFLKNPVIKLMTGKDKAVELEIEFIDEKVSPAFKVLSESQINSFGLSIFLSATKYFNSEFKFFILDDVVNSFDIHKRPKVGQLIAKKFNDFQALILTHDQIFFDIMQKAFPNWQRYKFISWDYTTGPKYKLSKNYTEEILELIDNDESIQAGQNLGRYLEWIFGILCESMQTPIKYKLENIYTLNEFYEPLTKRFREKLKLTGKQHKLILLFDELNNSTLFRNYCAHWKNEANPFTSNEIGNIFRIWLQIEDMIFCNKCKSYVKFESIGNFDYIKCNCGGIDLKKLDFYI